MIQTRKGPITTERWYNICQHVAGNYPQATPEMVEKYVLLALDFNPLKLNSMFYTSGVIMLACCMLNRFLERRANHRVIGCQKMIVYPELEIPIFHFTKFYYTMNMRLIWSY